MRSAKMQPSLNKEENSRNFVKHKKFKHENPLIWLTDGDVKRRMF